MFFLNRTFTFCAILKSCSKKLHVEKKKVEKSCNIKFLEPAYNIMLHKF